MRIHFKKGAAILVTILVDLPGSQERNNQLSVVNDVSVAKHIKAFIISYLSCFLLGQIFATDEAEDIMP